MSQIKRQRVGEQADEQCLVGVTKHVQGKKNWKSFAHDGGLFAVWTHQLYRGLARRDPELNVSVQTGIL